MKIEVRGVIVPDEQKRVYDWCGITATSPRDIKNAISRARAGEELEIIINSGGGSVFDGSDIYTSLKDYAGNVVVKISGVAASAASVIAMAGNKIMMSPTAQMMIHNSATRTEGNHEELGITAERLKRTDGTIANAYALKTGKSKDELLALMAKTTWMDVSEAKAANFIDEIMFTEQGTTLTASISNTDEVLPKEVIRKVLNQIATEKGTNNTTDKPLNNGSEIDNTQEKKEDEMTKEELKASNLELYNAIYNEGVKNERGRMQELDGVKALGSEELVLKAKYETFETKAEIAVKIIDGIGSAPPQAAVVVEGPVTDVLGNKLADVKASGVDKIEANLENETKEEKKKIKNKSLVEKIVNKINTDRGRD